MKKLVPLAVLLIVAVGLMFGLQWYASRPGHGPVAVKAVPVTDADLKGFQIYLQRKACRAQCPEYAVMARGDGSVDFEGLRFTAVSGTQKSTIDRGDLVQLVKAVRKVGFFSLADEYHPGGKKCEARILEGKPVVVGVSMHGQTHILHVDLGCSNLPDSISTFLEDVDRIIGTDRWVEPQQPTPAAS